jgi:subtilisin-like proprotein convertase family protein
MKTTLILTLLWMLATPAFGQQTYSTNVMVGAVVPDHNPNGLALPVLIGGLSGAISNVTVSVDITGGFNGDLYAYLAGPGGGFAVLLNRVGVSSTSTYGYSDQGFNVTFSDTAVNGDIHYYQNVLNPGAAALTGIWAPDGENINPGSAPSAFPAAQTAMLSSFAGADANGQWVFFIADLSSGGQSILANISLTIMTVPEPSTLALAMLGGMAAWVIRPCRRVKSFEDVPQAQGNTFEIKTKSETQTFA